MTKSDEKTFQNDLIQSLLAKGWLLGESKNYNRQSALYEEDVIGFVKDSQPKEWQKYVKNFGEKAEKRFIDRVVNQLDKTNPNSTDRELRSFGTLGVLRKGIVDTPCRFSLCQFKPEHELNPEILQRYKMNRLRVVPELEYSPFAEEDKNYRIDLVLFVNGIPVATLELKSEFKQAVENAIKQYKRDRLPKNPVTKKQEPLLTFKRGALVHFAVSQYEVYMCTKLAGNDSYFLPFNKGKKDGGKGNDIPNDPNSYATDYLWNEVLLPDNLLSILGEFIHLDIEEVEDAKGLKKKKESLIFPRYHQWDVVRNLIGAVKEEGAGQKYLIQHSAGSGKSNSIAWTAHQLASLYDEKGNKQFQSVIIVTDRTVLDAQLQDTISQFTDVEGIVGRINRLEGQGSKSEKLAQALESSQPIIIVTIQTFKFVLDCIEKSEKLRRNNYAVIADEAHSSQSGSNAKQLKEVLTAEEDETDDEDQINELATRSAMNISYFAFTATPKDKTMQLFGRCPDRTQPPSKENLPAPFHVYTMRQAIEEGFILDVLQNYTTYKTAYNLALKAEEADKEVDSKRAKTKLNQWVRLHPYNISQKVKIIVEHFRENVANLLHGQAKAMVVTSSRKEAVRYKINLDKYVREQGYKNIVAMVAFSGEVIDPEADDSGLNSTFTERNINPRLKGRDMRKAFDSEDYQLMLVANKFQTGFDQPKLCAMYVDKKLGGVECVQTLSRLNRIYPGKKECGTFVLDFFNEPQEILDAFQPYYQTAELADVSDPNLVHELFEKLKAAEIYTWNEVEQFYEAFHNPNKSPAAISNICKPAVERWQNRYNEIRDCLINAQDIFKRTLKSQDPVLIANAENSVKELKKELDKLIVFKKDLGSFTRFYEFMSQIVDYDNNNLDYLSLYARHLQPLLREAREEQEDIDLTAVVLTHYRVSKIREQRLILEDSDEYKINPSSELGTGKAKDKKEEFLSEILKRLNELFNGENLTDDDMLSYARTILGKIKENDKVMAQFRNNSPEQAMLGDYQQAFSDAIMESSEAHQNMMMQVLSNTTLMTGLQKLIYDMWRNDEKRNAG